MLLFFSLSFKHKRFSLETKEKLHTLAFFLLYLVFLFVGRVKV